MGVFDKIRENATNVVAKKLERAVKIAESQGGVNSSKMDELRQTAERAKHEAEMLRLKRNQS